MTKLTALEVHQIAISLRDNAEIDRSTADMSEPADTHSEFLSRRASSPDEQAFAQVERWMAVIREISLERPAGRNSTADQGELVTI